MLVIATSYRPRSMDQAKSKDAVTRCSRKPWEWHGRNQLGGWRQVRLGRETVIEGVKWNRDGFPFAASRVLGNVGRHFGDTQNRKLRRPFADVPKVKAMCPCLGCNVPFVPGHPE